MRNQFRKPKKVNCAYSLCTEKLPLQVIYANKVSIYDLQRCMNSERHVICLLIVFTFISHSCSNGVGVKCLSLSLCAFHAEDSFFDKKSMAQFTFFRFTEPISHVLFYLFV